MASLSDQIARDLQRKLNDDVVRATTRVMDIAPPEEYLALALQSVCATLDLSAQILETGGLGFSGNSRRLTIYLVALMAAHAYASEQPMFSAALVMRAREDMKRLGLFPPPPRSGAT